METQITPSLDLSIQAIVQEPKPIKKRDQVRMLFEMMSDPKPAEDPRGSLHAAEAFFDNLFAEKIQKVDSPASRLVLGSSEYIAFFPQARLSPFDTIAEREKKTVILQDQTEAIRESITQLSTANPEQKKFAQHIVSALSPEAPEIQVVGLPTKAVKVKEWDEVVRKPMSLDQIKGAERLPWAKLKEFNDVPHIYTLPEIAVGNAKISSVTIQKVISQPDWQNAGAYVSVTFDPESVSLITGKPVVQGLFVTKDTILGTTPEARDFVSRIHSFPGESSPSDDGEPIQLHVADLRMVINALSKDACQIPQETNHQVDKAQSSKNDRRRVPLHYFGNRVVTRGPERVREADSPFWIGGDYLYLTYLLKHPQRIHALSFSNGKNSEPRPLSEIEASVFAARVLSPNMDDVNDIETTFKTLPRMRKTLTSFLLGTATSGDIIQFKQFLQNLPDHVKASLANGNFTSQSEMLKRVQSQFNSSVDSGKISISTVKIAEENIIAALNQTYAQEVAEWVQEAKRNPLSSVRNDLKRAGFDFLVTELQLD